MSFIIRPARQNDAAFIAEMMYLSMGGLADYLFENIRQPVAALMKNLVARNTGRFGFEIAFVAEAEEKPVGALVSCAGARLAALNLSVLPNIFSVMGAIPALNFLWRGYSLPGSVEAEKDEYYLSNVGVHPSAQGQGIGSRLLAYAEQIARTSRLAKCSLVVGLHNVNAFRLYQRTGYQVVETVHDKNENLGYHRMVKQLS
ncbi:MAG: GNAT family N-acetyltransferase [Anaerolineales bacterium]|nr:GNAT family N-acetyltransferase [Anaerolineales bacterium]